MYADPWGQILNEFFNLDIKRARLLPENIVIVDGYDHNMYEWIKKTLSSWKDVSLVGVDSWQFENKKTAEKFITLFNLKWAT